MSVAPANPAGLLRLRPAGWPEPAHDAIVQYRAHVYRGRAARARAEAQWAREGLTLVDRLETAATAAAPRGAAGG